MLWKSLQTSGPRLWVLRVKMHVSPPADVHGVQCDKPCSGELSAGLTFIALKISTGKSAHPIMRLPKVPSIADAPPDMGSQGPSSVSYSRGR